MEFSKNVFSDIRAFNLILFLSQLVILTIWLTHQCKSWLLANIVSPDSYFFLKGLKFFQPKNCPTPWHCHSRTLLFRKYFNLCYFKSLNLCPAANCDQYLSSIKFFYKHQLKQYKVIKHNRIKKKSKDKRINKINTDYNTWGGTA